MRETGTVCVTAVAWGETGNVTTCPDCTAFKICNASAVRNPSVVKGVACGAVRDDIIVVLGVTCSPDVATETVMVCPGS